MLTFPVARGSSKNGALAPGVEVDAPPPGVGLPLLGSSVARGAGHGAGESRRSARRGRLSRVGWRLTAWRCRRVVQTRNHTDETWNRNGSGAKARSRTSRLATQDQRRIGRTWKGGAETWSHLRQSRGVHRSPRTVRCEPGGVRRKPGAPEHEARRARGRPAAGRQEPPGSIHVPGAARRKPAGVRSKREARPAGSRLNGASYLLRSGKGSVTCP